MGRIRHRRAVRLTVTGARLLAILGLVLVAAQCDNSGLNVIGGDPLNGGNSNSSGGNNSGGGGGNGGGGGGGGGGNGGGGGGGGGGTPVIGIDSYIYLSDQPVTTGTPASIRDFAAPTIVLAKAAKTDLTPYVGAKVYIDTPQGPLEKETDAEGKWGFRLDRAGGVMIDITDADGIPIMFNQPVSLSGTGLTPWPASDIDIPTDQLTNPVNVIIEEVRAR
jgi:hypothetical protein